MHILIVEDNALVASGIQAGLEAVIGMSFEEIQFELGVATQCGCCESCARDVVAQCSASQPVAALRNDAAPQAIQLASSILESKSWNSSQPSQAA